MSYVKLDNSNRNLMYR